MTKDAFQLDCLEMHRIIHGVELKPCTVFGPSLVIELPKLRQRLQIDRTIIQLSSASEEERVVELTLDRHLPQERWEDPLYHPRG